MAQQKKPCKYPGCNRAKIVSGMCHWHYERYTKVKGALEGKVDETSVHPYDFVAFYVMSTLEHGFCKIGMVRDPWHAKQSVQNGSPFKIYLRYASYCHPEVAAALEYETHKTLKDCDIHFRRDWFDLDPQDAIAAIRKVARNYNLITYEVLEYERLCQEDHGLGLTHRTKKRKEDANRHRTSDEVVAFMGSVDM